VQRGSRAGSVPAERFCAGIFVDGFSVIGILMGLCKMPFASMLRAWEGILSGGLVELLTVVA